jgi:hypothetical protein
LAEKIIVLRWEQEWNMYFTTTFGAFVTVHGTVTMIGKGIMWYKEESRSSEWRYVMKSSSVVFLKRCKCSLKGNITYFIVVFYLFNRQT